MSSVSDWNIALTGINDGHDTSRIIEMCNDIITSKNDGLEDNKFLVATYTYRSEVRKYQIGIDIDKSLIAIKRIQ